MENAHRTLLLTSAANAGVLVEYGTRRLLLDGIRSQPFAPFLPTPPQILAEMLHGPEPSRWRNIDYLFFTHLHPDHFQAQPVEDYLRFNRVQRVFAPQWPLKPFPGLHLCAPEDGAYADFALAPDLSLRTIGTTHMGEAYAGIRNNALLLTAGGRKILFAGDGDAVPAWYQAAGRVDALFVNPLFLNKRAMAELLEAHAPQTVFVYHLTERSQERESLFYWRVAERAAGRLSPQEVRFFPAGTSIAL